VILDAANVTVRYTAGAAPVLADVSCSVEGSRLVAVVGPNGSGKTTLVRAVSGLVSLSAGSVRIEGRPVGDWQRGALARVLAVVSQREESVFPLSVEETVMLGRYARLGPLAAPSAADHDRVMEALRRCDISELATRPVDSLSGGEWQRVRIARALAQEPRLLVLDEPTASLDVRHEMELFELVRGLVDAGLAAVVITHHLNLAARYADRMLLLSGARVVADGPPAAVLRQEVLREVFEWPVAVTTWCDGSPQVVPLRPNEVGQ
jgi:iron complex transport system ATP-binding protein